LQRGSSQALHHPRLRCPPVGYPSAKKPVSSILGFSRKKWKTSQRTTEGEEPARNSSPRFLPAAQLGAPPSDRTAYGRLSILIPDLVYTNGRYHSAKLPVCSILGFWRKKFEGKTGPENRGDVGNPNSIVCLICHIWCRHEGP